MRFYDIYGSIVVVLRMNQLYSGSLFFLSLIRFFFFKQKPAYEMRISDWSSDVCSSDLADGTCEPEVLRRLPRHARYAPCRYRARQCQRFRHGASAVQARDLHPVAADAACAHFAGRQTARSERAQVPA